MRVLNKRGKWRVYDGNTFVRLFNTEKEALDFIAPQTVEEPTVEEIVDEIVEQEYDLIYEDWYDTRKSS